MLGQDMGLVQDMGTVQGMLEHVQDKVEDRTLGQDIVFAQDMAEAGQHMLVEEWQIAVLELLEGMGRSDHIVVVEDMRYQDKVLQQLQLPSESWWGNHKMCREILAGMCMPQQFLLRNKVFEMTLGIGKWTRNFFPSNSCGHLDLCK